MQTDPETAGTLTEFTGLLLEYLILKAGSTKLRAKKMGEATYLTIGDKSFSGRSTEHAFDQALLHVTTTKSTLRPDQIEAAALQAEAKERRDDAAFMEQLTGGGMSDLGRTVEMVKALRKVKVRDHYNQLIVQTDWEMVLTPVSLLAELKRRTGLEDLTLDEVTHALDLRPAQMLPEH